MAYIRKAAKKRLTKLTPAMIAAIPEWIDKWIEIGTRTGPADRQRFEAAIHDCYRFAGLEPPKVIVWAPSPIVVSYAGPLAAPTLELLKNPPKDRDSIGASIDASIGDSIGASIDASIGASIGASIRASIRASDTKLREYLLRSYYLSFRGQFGSGYWWGGAWSSYFRDVCGVELPDDLWPRAQAFEATIESACWWYPHRDFVIVSERPQVIRLEYTANTPTRRATRLHCADGPALAFQGWELHFWHGTRVPADLIEGDGWTLERIMAERNTEIRRCAIERMGWDRFIGEAHLTPVDECADVANPGNVLQLFDLPASLNPYPEPVRLLLMTNASPSRDGTVRRYGESVPATCRTALDAAAWQFNCDPDMYRTLQRAT